MFEKEFPNLTDPLSKKTSEPTPRYNCIAWAFEDNTRWWWPQRGGYWPTSFVGKTVGDAFAEMLELGGWEKTGNSSLEIGFKKIAVYSSLANGQPTHAARMLANGRWTSKLGTDLDLTHDLIDLVGPVYGTLISVYRKQISFTPAKS